LTTLPKKVQMRWYWWGLLVLLLSLTSYALAVRIVNSIDYHNNDFFTFWLAGHMVMHGGNPYSSVQWVAGHHEFDVTWIPNQAYVYPLPLSLLFAPLGWLSLYQAYIVWVALSIMMILAVLMLLLRTQAGSVRFMIPLIVGILFFRPTILTLVTGQISGWLLLILAITALLWEKGKWNWGSLLLAFLMLKPNLGTPLIILLGSWLLLQKRYQAILTMAVMGIILLLVGFLQNPYWVSDYWGIGSTKLSQTFGGSPTVWGLGALISHNQITTTLVIGSLAGLVILFGFFWAIIRMHASLRPMSVLALAVSVTLLVTPYTWTYDQLLLILPLSAVILAMDRRGAPFLLSAGLFLAVDVLVVILLYFDVMEQVEILNVFVPMLVFGLCLWWLACKVPGPAGENVSQS
jgi:Glycosyltransferase family 87